MNRKNEASAAVKYLSDYRWIMLIIFSVICLVVNISTYLVYRQNQAVNNSRQWVFHTYQVIEETQGLFAKLQKIELRRRGYLITRNNEFLASIEQDSNDVLEGLQKVKDLTRDNPHEQARLSELEGLIERQFGLMNSQAIGSGLTAVMEASRENLIRIATLKDEVIEEETELLTLRSAAEESNQQRYFSVLIVSSAASVIILFIANSVILYITTKRRQVEKSLNVAERELSRTNERLQLALKGTMDGLFDWKIGAGEVYYSPRYKEILGFADDEMENSLEEFDTRIHPDDAKAFHDYTEGYLKREFSEYRNFFRMRHKDSGWRWIMARALALYDAEGKPYRLIGTHTDITDMKNLEEKLKASNKELEGFTYIASHDLRSPLVNLKGFSGEMKRSLNNIRPMLDKVSSALEAEEREAMEKVLSVEIPEALEFINSSVQRMDKLTNSILELSRIGRRDMKFEKLDMNKIVKGCINSLQYQISAKQVEISVGDLPEITGDYISLEQVIGNIIDNAVKYLDTKRPGKIRIEGKRGPSETLYSVSDNGRGIAKEDFYKIFEIFRRAGPQDVPGEGMGMAYVKAILRRHGGDIWCDSELGAGTVFYFTIANNLT